MAFALTAGLLSGCFMGRLDAKRTEEAASRLGYKHGRQLAEWQDSLLARHGRDEKIADRELEQLRGNPWVRSARTLAPGNLVIRHWALIDLFSGSPRHAERILEMSKLFVQEDSAAAGSSQGALWLEGYGYWMYTRAALEPWTLRFAGREEAVRLRSLMRAVDSCFAVTAYEREGVWYPAPFGDLRDIPLEEPAATLRKEMRDSETCGFARVEATDDTIRYRIAARPVGLNTHVPHESTRVTVRGGKPEGFAFYEGYERKYADSTEEVRDMLRPERVRSIDALRLRERFGR